jgi:hypothetical protein
MSASGNSSRAITLPLSSFFLTSSGYCQSKYNFCRLRPGPIYPFSESLGKRSRYSFSHTAFAELTKELS